jgi:hypothetical protein
MDLVITFPLAGHPSCVGRRADFPLLAIANDVGSLTQLKLAPEKMRIVNCCPKID